MYTGKPVVKVCVSLHVSLDFNHFILMHSSIWVDTFNNNGPRIVHNDHFSKCVTAQVRRFV